MLNVLPDQPVFDEHVPVIDLSATGTREGSARIVREIGAACRDVGFLVVTGHSVPERLVARMDAVTRQLFTQPQVSRDLLKPDPADPMQRGYGEDNGSLSPGTAPDLRWAFGINPMNEPGLGRELDPSSPLWRRYRYPNRWPDLPGFRDTWLAYFRAMELLAFRLLEYMAVDLGLPPDYFAGFHTRAPSNLLANWYPAQDRPPAENQFRIGQHTDWGSITVLYQDGEPGLQVLGRDGQWHLVPPLPGTFVINLGDMLQVWTGGLYRSTEHRVLNPSRKQAGRPRLSVPYFGQPDDLAVIQTPPQVLAQGGKRFGPVVSGEWFAAKLKAVRAPAA